MAGSGNENIVVAPVPQESSSQEALEWNRIKDSSDAGAFEKYIQKFPNAPFVIAAQKKLDALKQAQREREAAQKAAEDARIQTEQKKAAEAAAKRREEDERRAKAAEAEQKAEQAERERAAAEAAAAHAAAEKQAKEAEEARKKAERDAKATEDAVCQTEQSKLDQIVAKGSVGTGIDDLNAFAKSVTCERLSAQIVAAIDKFHAEAAALASLPSFPWPPPSASAWYVLPQNLFGNAPTIGAESDAIVVALDQNGYVERSFYRTPRGLALITRLERIMDDGSPASSTSRWGGDDPTTSLDLSQFLAGLFFAKTGHYRVIVFIIQYTPFEQSPDKQLSGEQAEVILKSGSNMLPPEVAQLSIEGSHCTALIYEFANDRRGRHKLHKIESSRLTGKQHLEKAGLLAAIEKPR
jgi:hypothetical protein